MCFVLFYSFAQANLLWHFFKFKDRKMPMATINDKGLPKVTVQLPIFNEKYVVERLIEAISSMHYPKENWKFKFWMTALMKLLTSLITV